VYWFLSHDGSVLYVGKAKDLKKRISQYRQYARLAPDKQHLVEEAVSVQCEVRQSELEALFVEAELVRRYQPRFNILLKDDKSPIYVVITKEEFPRVLTARRREIDMGNIQGDVFGPFSSGYLIKNVLRSIRPIFQWCSIAAKRKGIDREHGRPCFYYHLGQCSGACVGQISSVEYKQNIRRLKAFLRGQTSVILRKLKQEIVLLAASERFEEAEQLRQQYVAIEKVTDPSYKIGPDIALPRLRTAFGIEATKRLGEVVRKHLELHDTWEPLRIEGYDVSNFQGKLAVVSLVCFVDGVQESAGYRTFHIRRKDTPDDYGMLKQVLTRRQNHEEWGIPDLILIDGGKGQLNAVKDVWRWPTPVVSIAKDPDRLVISTSNGFVLIPASELGPAGQLISQIRDEAHRFAKKGVKKRLVKRDILV
jgi:excinuclease ABC subunit C